jgi:hypothetical protein
MSHGALRDVFVDLLVEIVCGNDVVLEIPRVHARSLLTGCVLDGGLGGSENAQFGLAIVHAFYLLSSKNVVRSAGKNVYPSHDRFMLHAVQCLGTALNSGCG